MLLMEQQLPSRENLSRLLVLERLSVQTLELRGALQRLLAIAQLVRNANLFEEPSAVGLEPILLPLQAHEVLLGLFLLPLLQKRCLLADVLDAAELEALILPASKKARYLLQLTLAPEIQLALVLAQQRGIDLHLILDFALVLLLPLE